MRATVAVATRNRRSMLEECLGSLGDQTAEPDDFEVVVVDNGSTDGTAELLVDWAARDPGRRRVVHEPEAGLSRARNRAIAAALGDVVAFLDDDAVAPRGWVAAHLAGYARHPDVVAVGGPVVLTWPGGRPPWMTRRLDHWFSALDLGDTSGPFTDGHGPYGTNMSVRTDALREVGGFATELGRRGRRLMSSEEHDLFKRLWAKSRTIMYEPAALVLHRVMHDRATRRWILRRGWAQGRSNARVRARHPEEGGDVASICRAEIGHAVRGLGGVVRSAVRHDESTVLDEVARRAGHVSGAIDQVLLAVHNGRARTRASVK